MQRSSSYRTALLLGILALALAGCAPEEFDLSWRGRIYTVSFDQDGRLSPPVAVAPGSTCSYQLRAQERNSSGQPVPGEVLEFAGDLTIAGRGEYEIELKDLSFRERDQQQTSEEFGAIIEISVKCGESYSAHRSLTVTPEMIRSREFRRQLRVSPGFSKIELKLEKADKVHERIRQLPQVNVFRSDSALIGQYFEADRSIGALYFLKSTN